MEFHYLLKKWAKPGHFLIIFVLFTASTNLTINYKSKDGVLGTRTRAAG